MKATDLAKIIYECDIHALTDYYSFVEVEYVRGIKRNV